MDCRGLKKVTSQVWQGVLLINLSGHCETFDGYFRAGSRDDL